MLKKILAMLLLPIQVLLLVLMLPLVLIFGTGLLSMLVPPNRRSPRPPIDEEEEVEAES